jgi:hypothetical protein
MRRLLGVVDEMNTYDARRLDEIDSGRRALAFNTLQEVVLHDDALPLHVAVPLIAHNCTHTLAHVVDLSLREQARLSLRQMIAYTASRGGEDMLVNLVLPLVRAGLGHRQEAVRLDYVSLLAAVVRAYPNSCHVRGLSLLTDRTLYAGKEPNGITTTTTSPSAFGDLNIPDDDEHYDNDFFAQVSRCASVEFY